MIWPEPANRKDLMENFETKASPWIAAVLSLIQFSIFPIQHAQYEPCQCLSSRRYCSCKNHWIWSMARHCQFLCGSVLAAAYLYIGHREPAPGRLWRQGKSSTPCQHPIPPAKRQRLVGPPLAQDRPRNLLTALFQCLRTEAKSAAADGGRD